MDPALPGPTCLQARSSTNTLAKLQSSCIKYSTYLLMLKAIVGKCAGRPRLWLDPCCLECPQDLRPRVLSVWRDICPTSHMRTTNEARTRIRGGGEEHIPLTLHSAQPADVWIVQQVQASWLIIFSHFL